MPEGAGRDRTRAELRAEAPRRNPERSQGPYYLKCQKKLEARGGIEPPHKGFADLYKNGLNPSVYAASAHFALCFGPTLVRPLI